MRHIIIEGPDGAGKTTLARRLCHVHAMAYHHEGPPPAGTSALHHYAGLLANATRPTVFDRFHLGELVYAPLLRGQPGLAPEEVTLMNRLIAGTGTRLVGCLPSWQTCWASNQAKRELIDDPTVMRAAYDAWRVTFDDVRAFHRGTRYNYAQAGVDPPPGPRTDRADRLPDGVIGYPGARVLFVGEQPNSGTLDLPFFGTARSSGYLNARIVEAGLAEETLAFTNALDMQGQTRDLAFIVTQMLRLDVIVPLGRVAANQIARQNVPLVRVHQLPHPQFWKRFHALETREYARMLEALRAA